MGTVADALEISAFSQRDFVRLLNHVLQQLTISQVMIGKAAPLPPDHECVEVYPKFVFDIPLSGTKQVICGNGVCRQELILKPGQVLFSAPGVWKLPLWTCPHELLCLVFTKEFLRCTYVDNSVPTGKRPVCVHFHHSISAPDPLLKSLLDCLTRLDGSPVADDVAPELTRSLFRLSLDLLDCDIPKPYGKAERTFQRVNQYLHENFNLPLTREETAARFHLTAGYLSRLFRQQADETFSGTLRKIRMEHAAYLLSHTELLVDEITVQCGYRSTPFFTSAFREHHGMPPGRFRNRLR